MMCKVKFAVTVSVVILTVFHLGSSSSPPFCVCERRNDDQLQDCKPLEDHFNSWIPNFSVFSFCPGPHSLSTPKNITGAFNITLEAAELGDDVTVECNSTGDAGIAFFNTTGLTIRGITIQNCGMHVIIQDNRSVKAALVFEGGEDLILQSILVKRSSVAAFSVIDVTGYVLIKNSVFADAYIREENEEYLSGSFIGYTNHSQIMAQMVTVKVANTHFKNNAYQLRYRNRSCDSTDRRQSAGLSIFLSRGSVNISFSNVSLSGNGGCAGGNMAIMLFNVHNLVGNTHICIGNGSTVEKGHSNVGGGVSVILTSSAGNSSRSTDNGNQLPLLYIHDTTFHKNRASFVGGALYLKHMETEGSPQAPGIIEIMNCTFEGNHLTGTTKGGMALHIVTFVVEEYKFHTRPQLRVLVSLCHFVGHTSKHSGELGNAVIFVKTSPYVRISNTSIVDNNSTGILVISSNIIVSGQLTISRNSAFNGGGLLLCADAVLFFKRSSHLLITGNRAENTGGGINIESECTVNRPRCFFQYDQNEKTSLPKVTMKENTAGIAGYNIYGGSVEDCYLINSKNRSLDSFRKIFVVPSNNISHNSSSSSIASSPKQVCVVNNQTHTIDCGRIEKEIYPGETLHIDGVVILGQLNGVVPGAVYVSMKKKWRNRAFIQKKDKVQTIPPGKSQQQLTYRIYSKRVNINVKLYLSVMPTGAGHKTSLIVSVIIKPCPLGYALNSKSTQTSCSCAKLRLYAPKKLTCYISSKVGIQYQPPTWIGKVQMNESSFFAIAVSGTCPQDYCNDTQKMFLDFKTLLVNSTKQCYFNRTGVLCGGCMEGYSLLLGSSRCSKDCSNYHLFLLIAFASAGIALVFLLYLLNLTVTEGTMNGLIFYANIIQIYAFFMFEKNNNGFAKFLKVFIAWLNLDFGIETCFFVGMDSFSKTLLQFIFPLYLWIIAGTIIWLSRYDIIAKFCGANSVKVLATLILLSYSKILRALVGSLHFTPVYYIFQNDAVETALLHWTMDGRVRYLKGKHIVVFCVGLIFVVCILPFMLTLLCIQKIGLVSNWPCFSWVYRLKPFFDSFTGPLTDRGRFWIGFLLLIRILIIAVYSFNISNSNSIVMAVIVTICFLLLLIQSLLPKGVYDNNTLNTLETFFIANLGCLFLGLFCSIHYNSTIVKTCVVSISIGLSFLVFLLIIVRHILVRMRCQHALEMLRFKRRYYREQHSYMENEGSASHTTLHQPPYAYSSNGEREPLLSSLDS
jgi:hypothetical protein